MSDFTGKITEISEIKTGKTRKGDDWASVDFEVTESNPNNVDYPQIALFSYFKSGEYFKFANEFNDFNKLGDEIVVDYNFKCNKYNKKDGGEGKFYKNDCWKFAKTNVSIEKDAGLVVEDENPDDLPF